MPWLKDKTSLDMEDEGYVSLSNKIEMVYKKICKTTMDSVLPTRKIEFTPIKIKSQKEVK